MLCSLFACYLLGCLFKISWSAHYDRHLHEHKHECGRSNRREIQARTMDSNWPLTESRRLTKMQRIVWGELRDRNAQVGLQRLQQNETFISTTPACSWLWQLVKVTRACMDGQRCRLTHTYYHCVHFEDLTWTVSVKTSTLTEGSLDYKPQSSMSLHEWQSTGM